MRRLVWFACTFAAAVLLCVYVLPGIPIWLGVVAVALGGGLLCLRRKRLRRVCCLLLGFGVGLLWTGLYYQTQLRPALCLTGEAQTITATVASYPAQTRYGQRLDVLLDCGGTRCRTLLYLRETDVKAAPGDQLSVKAEVEAASLQARTEEENLYARSRGYVLQAYAKGDARVTPQAKRPLWACPAWLAWQLQGKITALFPADTAPFLQALLTGDRSGFSYADKNALSLAGVSHVVAISGMHVSILLAMLLLFLRRRGLAAAIGIPVVVCYALLTGAAPSVIRAAVMQILLLLAPLVKREEDTPTSLCAAMLVILLQNPWAVADLSFQLSFASMAGLLLFGNRLYHAMARRARRKLPALAAKLRAALFASVSASLGAMVFTTPLVACSFDLVSLAAIGVNFLVLWAVSLCFQLGLVICLVGFVLPGVAAFFAGLLSWLVRYFWWIVRGAARLPFAAVYTSSVYLAAWVVFAYLLLAVFLLQKQKRPLQFALCLAVSLAASVGLSWLENSLAEVQTTVLDVGQGQCVLLEVDGKSILVDCGGSNPEEAGEQAARALLAHGKFHLDLLLLTHYDADHAGGAAYLLGRIPVRQLYLPPVDTESALCTAIGQAAAETGTTLEYLQEDRTLHLGQSQLQIFGPVSRLPGNDGGLSVLCSRGDYDILITGDMSLDGEARLLALHTLPKVEVMLAGHHGAATSTGAPLLAAVRPEIAVISVGRGNWYGHPRAETMERLRSCGAAIYRTDQNGTVTIRR